MFLGNSDNMNIRVASWFRKSGIHAELWRTDPDGPDEGLRGNLREYLGTDPDGLDWIKRCPIDDVLLEACASPQHPLRTEIERSFDFVVVNGAKALLLSAHLSRPTVIIPSGYEIGSFWRFIDQYRTPKEEASYWINLLKQKKLKSAFSYRRRIIQLGRGAIKKALMNVDTYRGHDSIYRRIGATRSLARINLGEDCQKARDLVNRPLLAELNKKYGHSKLTILSLSRIFFSDPKSILYKGTHLFFQSLEALAPLIESGQISVVMGKHGQELDLFEKKFGHSPVFKKINWVSHLDFPTLVTYLSMDNAFLVAEFGKKNSVISGIGRDAIAIGTPFLSQVAPSATVEQFGAPVPSFYAARVPEIVQQLKQVFDMEPQAFQQLRRQMKEFADLHHDYRAYVPRFLSALEDKLEHQGG